MSELDIGTFSDEKTTSLASNREDNGLTLKAINDRTFIFKNNNRYTQVDKTNIDKLVAQEISKGGKKSKTKRTKRTKRRNKKSKRRTHK